MHDCTVTPSPGVPPRGNRGCLLAHGLHFGGTQGPWRPYACGSATSHGTRNPHNRWRRRGGGAASPDAGRFLDRIRVRVRIARVLVLRMLFWHGGGGERLPQARGNVESQRPDRRRDDRVDQEYKRRDLDGGQRIAGGLLLSSSDRWVLPARRRRPGVALHRRDGRVRLRVRDRKSTRLNSSHLVISYAVFCLKKKKKD